MKKLKKKLDDVFSLFIRLRDSDSEGIGFCVTCKKPKYFAEADNGHYVKRQYLATRYSEINCKLQCKPCNGWGQGADEKFRAELVKEHGEQNILLLEASKNNKTMYTRVIYEHLITLNQHRIVDLMDDKDFELSAHHKRLLK